MKVKTISSFSFFYFKIVSSQNQLRTREAVQVFIKFVKSLDFSMWNPKRKKKEQLVFLLCYPSIKIDALFDYYFV